MDPNWYQSVAGIAAASYFAGEATKRWHWLARQPVAREVPLVAYVVVYALLFTLVAHQVMHAIEGDFWQAVVKAVTAGVAAVGARSIWSNGRKPLADSMQEPKP